MRNLLSCIILIIILHFVPNSSSKKITVPEGFPIGFDCNVNRLKFSPKARPRRRNSVVECQIMLNSSVVFAKTMKWRQRSIVRYGIDASHDDVITVLVKHKNVTRKMRNTIAVDRAGGSCHTNGSTVVRDWEEGDDVSFTCYVPVERKMITKSQFDQLSFTVFKDCRPMNLSDEDLSITHNNTNYSKLKLGGVRLKNSSYARTPGSYQCVILYKGRQYSFDDKYSRINVCIKGKIPVNENPSITPTLKSYKAEPGTDLNLTCISKRRSYGTLNNKIFFYRGNETEPLPGKVYRYLEEGRRCTPTPDEDVAQFRDKLGDYLSVYTLRNVAIDDSGNYRCALYSIDLTVTADFSVIVRVKTSSLVRPWTIAVIVVAACLVIVFLATLLRYRLPRERKYFVKKYFTKPIVVPEDTTVAFLVYCEDVFHKDMTENPLSQLIDWMDRKKIRYHDANRYCPADKLQDPGPERMKEAIKSSMSLIIILSRDLLIKNDLEIFTSYMALNHNVESSQSVIFVCTKEMKRTVFEKEVYSEQLDPDEQEAVNKTVTTFKNFMKRRENHVVCWSPKNISQFQKDIYVALPKVMPEKTEQHNFVVYNKLDGSRS